MVSVREAWLGIKDGAQNSEVRQTIFTAPDGCRGVLAEWPGLGPSGGLDVPVV